MASQIETAFANLARGPLFSLAGTAAVHTAAGSSSGTSCTVIVEPEPGAAVPGVSGDYSQRSAILRVRASEIAAPAREDKFLVDGDTWTIVAPPNQQGGVWECRCEALALHRAGPQRRSN